MIEHTRNPCCTDAALNILISHSGFIETSQTVSNLYLSVPHNEHNHYPIVYTITQYIAMYCPLVNYIVVYSTHSVLH